MSKKGSHQIKDYFDFVVPPLEGFWWQDALKALIMLIKKDSILFPAFGCLSL